MCQELSPETRTEAENAGFTILEVLIAIAVVASSLTAIGLLTGATTRGVRSLEQHVALVETARSVAAIVPSGANLSSIESVGELYGNRWRIGVSPFSGSAPVPESPWIPVTLVISIESPSGAALSLESVRLLRKRE